MPTCTFKVSGDEMLVVPVIITNPKSGQALTINAEIDTGAARTQMKNGIAERLELPIYGSELIGSINSTIPCNSYIANIELQFKDGFVEDLGEYCIVDGLTTGECLLGRDILCSGLLIYNGINNYFTLSF